jgi:hypothetical protein
VKPATVPGLFRRNRIPEIPGEEPLAWCVSLGTHQKRVLFTFRHGFPRRIDRTPIHDVTRHADTATLRGTLERGRIGDGRAAGFGHRPAFNDRQIETALELAFVRDLDTGAEGETCLVAPVILALSAFEQDELRSVFKQQGNAGLTPVSGRHIALGQGIDPPGRIPVGDGKPWDAQVSSAQAGARKKICSAMRHAEQQKAREGVVISVIFSLVRLFPEEGTAKTPAISDSKGCRV